MAAVQNQLRSSFRGVLIGSAVLAALTAGSAGGYWAGTLSAAHSARTIVAPADPGKDPVPDWMRQGTGPTDADALEEAQHSATESATGNGLVYIPEP